MKRSKAIRSEPVSLGKDTEEEGDYIGKKILLGERVVQTTYWVPQPSAGTGKTSPLAGLKIRRAVGNLDSASEELTHICYSWEQGRGSRLKLPRMLAGFP